MFSHNITFGRGRSVYLVDANIFIYALNNDERYGKHCQIALSESVATTEQVLAEVKQENIYNIRVYKVKKISPEVNALRYENDKMKTLSEADKSLIQCAIDNPEICGIITNDFDIKSVVPDHLIKSEVKFFVGRPHEFLKKMGRL